MVSAGVSLLSSHLQKGPGSSGSGRFPAVPVRGAERLAATLRDREAVQRAQAQGET